MQYFGGGVSGHLHPSLRTYIDCFKSPPLPKMYPRGGGPWDQDPILMRDFRLISKLEIQYKQTQEQLADINSDSPGGAEAGGSGMGLEAALDKFIAEQDEGDIF